MTKINAKDIVHDMISRDNKCTICGLTTGNMPECPNCRAQLSLIAKNPNSAESKFYKRELDRKRKQNAN